MLCVVLLNVYIVQDIYIEWIIDKGRTYFHFITKLPMARLWPVSRLWCTISPTFANR